MTDQLNKSDYQDNTELPKREYHSPTLHQYGSVTDLTNGAIGTCQDDGNNCPIGAGAMQMAP